MITKLYDGTTIPQSFINTLNGSSRMFDVKLYSNGTQLNYSIKDLIIHKGACGKFAIGSLFIPYIELSVFGEIDFPDEIEVRVSVAENHVFSHYIRLGYFYPTEKESKTKVSKCTAQGIISQMAKQVLFQTEPTTKTLSGIITALNSGGFTVISDINVPVATITEPLIGLTYREVLTIVTTCLGGYATEDADGNIRIKAYSVSGSFLEEDGDRLFNYPAVNGECSITSIKVVAGDDTYSYPDDPDEGVAINIENPYFTQDMFTGAFLANVGLEFGIGSMKLVLGDPRLEPWDYIKWITGTTSFVKIPCFDIIHNLSGGCTSQITADADTLMSQSTATPGGIVETAKEAYTKAIAAQEAVNSALVSSVVQYALGDDDVTAPETGWSTTAPPREEGKYMWQRTVNTTKGGQTTISVTCIQGADGEDGQPADVYEIEWIMTAAPNGQITVKIYKNGVLDTGTRGLLVKYSKTIDGEPLYLSPASGEITGTKTWVYGSGTSHDGAYKFALQLQDIDTHTEDYILATALASVGIEGTSITIKNIKYAAGTSPTSAPTTGWQDTPISVGAGLYLWTRTTYSDDSTAYSVARQGENGQQGQPGTSITIQTQSVQYQESTSGTVTPTGTWQNNPPSVAAGHFLWTRTKVKYSDNTETVSYAVSYAGTNGQPGTPGTSPTVSSTVTKYAQSTNGTSHPTTGWSTTPPTAEAGKYMWTQTTVTYSDGATAVSYMVSKNGTNGAKGDPGDPGSQGRGISSAQEQWSIGTAAASDGNWSTTKPTQTDAKPMLWYRQKFTWSDGSITYSPGSAGMWAILSVAKLSAITANLGTITSGEIQVKSGNDILARLGVATTIGGVSYPSGIFAKSGKIGGFDIMASNIHHTKTSYEATGDGLYIGTDGIACGDGFKVSDEGFVTINNGVLKFEKDTGYGALLKLDINQDGLVSNGDYTGQGGPVVVNWQLMDWGLSFFEGTGEPDEDVVTINYYSAKSMLQWSGWVTEGYTVSASIAAGGSADVTKVVTKAGYMAIGIVGWATTAAKTSCSGCFVDPNASIWGQCTIQAHLVNHDSSKKTVYATPRVLWIPM